MTYKLKFEQSLKNNLETSKAFGGKSELKKVMIAIKNKNPSFIDKVLSNNFTKLNDKSSENDINKSAKLYSKLLIREVKLENGVIIFSDSLLKTDLKYKSSTKDKKELIKSDMKVAAVKQPGIDHQKKQTELDNNKTNYKTVKNEKLKRQTQKNLEPIPKIISHPTEPKNPTRNKSFNM